MKFQLGRRILDAILILSFISGVSLLAYRVMAKSKPDWFPLIKLTDLAPSTDSWASPKRK